MKNKIVLAMAGFFVVLTQAILVSPLLYADKVGISDVKNTSCQKTGGTVNASGNCEGGKSVTNIFSAVANIILFLVGAVAVIVLIIGGFKYVTSNGDQNAVTSAKNTIMYAVIGIIVAFLAYAAVNFVSSQLQEQSKTAVDCSGKSDADKAAIQNSTDKRCQ